MFHMHSKDDRCYSQKIFWSGQLAEEEACLVWQKELVGSATDYHGWQCILVNKTYGRHVSCMNNDGNIYICSEIYYNVQQIYQRCEYVRNVTDNIYVASLFEDTGPNMRWFTTLNYKIVWNRGMRNPNTGCVYIRMFCFQN